MATRIKLTQGRVDGFSCPPGKDQDFLRDSEMPGLALRATAAGNKGYVYEGKLDGKTIRVTIGDPEALNLAEARDKAAEIRVMIRAGRDPRVVKAEAIAADAAKRQKAKTETTPALEAWQAYITARTPRWSARHCADHEYMAREGGQAITRGRRAGMAEAKEPGILRPLLEKPLRAIDRDAVAVWLAVEVERRPTRARLAVALLGAFLRWCADNPAYRDQANPDAVARMKKDMPRPGARDDCLQREQLQPWFDAVGKIPNPTQSAYLQTLLLTGARRNELAPLQWADVDLQWNSLTIRDKVEGERTIPLTPYVKALLLSIKPASISSLRGGAATAASPFVFASNSSSGHITEPRIAHNRALAAAGLPPLTLHGLRRSFGTLAEWVEAPAGVVAQVMGHAPSAIAEKHYRRRPLDLLRMWHTKIEGWVLEQAGIEQPANKAAKPKAVTAA
ncbi:integrase family protein [Castellaniella sp.]|uniref:tyrosine-type recombinase/integrase n=1 Tax=Castellaniella sp. TaxID=1955812 RepID=UPI002AFF2AFB|nr:integrase family protein [Castellaniella sp.]